MLLVLNKKLLTVRALYSNHVSYWTQLKKIIHYIIVLFKFYHILLVLELYREVKGCRYIQFMMNMLLTQIMNDD